jgi:hypothetical protein
MAQNRESSSASSDDTGGGMFTVISVTVLVGTEIIGAALAGGWALAGSFDLGPVLTYALMAILGAGGLALLGMFVRSALRVEGAGRRA